MIEIRNKKILLLGLGLHGGGIATARWLLKHGAQLIVSDLKTKTQLDQSLKALAQSKNIKFVLGEHRDQDVRWADIIVYNPGVPRESRYLELGRELGKIIVNETTLFFDRCKAPIVAVTGTRGKSTTTSLIGAILKMDSHFQGGAGLKSGAQSSVFVAGNIRDTVMLDVVDKIKADDIVVLELSSWQLEGLALIKRSPHIAVLTNLYPDHLNRYKTLADYYDSKKEIFRYQTKNDYLILNGDNKPARSWAKEAPSQIKFFTKRLLDSGYTFKMPGDHNRENAAAAVTVARILGITEAKIKKALSTPPVLTGREEIIAIKNDITFVNDTCATTAEAGIAALRRFSSIDGKNKRILLIAGGADKGLNYDEWARIVKKFCRRVFLLVGNASDKMAISLKGCKNLTTNYKNLDSIMKEINISAQPNDIVLFSPAAASFNLWQHEFERGEDFNSAVKNTG